MSYDFDENGNITPYQVINGSLKTIKCNFVDKYKKDSTTRHVIWSKYCDYNRDLYNELHIPFKQICFGSFVTQKHSPSDIDIVNLIPHHKATNKLENYINNEAMEKYNTDAYLIPVYDKVSPLHAVTQALINKRVKFGLYDDRTRKRRGAIEVEVNDETV